MRILITNERLLLRGGREPRVRDLARGLNALGHSVMAYTSDPIHLERLLENDVIPVAADLEKLPFKPDVIHGRHSLDVMAALAALPGVPAVYHCQAIPGRWSLPRHPRILRYLAASKTIAEHIMVEFAVAPRDVAVFLNDVDLARFHDVRKLPEKPGRALIYDDFHTDRSQTVHAIREAAARLGIGLEFLGRGFGRWAGSPERVLPCHDIVFASGIPAMEAIACGCAVIVLGRAGCGGMVLPENVDRFRRENWSITTDSSTPSAGWIEAELLRYSAVRCAEVTARVRQEGDFNRWVSELTAVYETVIAGHQATKTDPDAESFALSRYLRGLTPCLKRLEAMSEDIDGPDTGAGMPGDFGARLERIEEQLKATAPVTSRTP